jgi:hypothetical protein
MAPFERPEAVAVALREWLMQIERGGGADAGRK